MNWIKTQEFRNFLLTGKILLLSLVLYLSWLHRNFSLLLLALLFLFVVLVIELPRNSFLLVSSSITFVLLLVEIGLGFQSNKVETATIGWRASDYKQLFSSVENGSWHLKPIRNFRHKDDLGEFDYVINMQMCGVSTSREVCHTSAQMWHFGDSFTFGFGVKAENTFVSLFSQNGIPSNNYGVPGFSAIELIDHAQKQVSSDSDINKPKSLFLHFFLGNDVPETLIRELPILNYTSSNLLEKVSSYSNLKQLADRAVLGYRAYDRKISERFVWNSEHMQNISGDYWFHNGQTFLKLLDASLSNLRKVFTGDISASLIPPKEICLVDDAGWFAMVNDMKLILAKHQIKVYDFYSIVGCNTLLGGYFSSDIHFNTLGHEMLFEAISKN
jgi:hypothetical protein